MIDATALRARLDARIAAAERMKFTSRQQPVKACAHDLQRYRQTVVPNSEAFKGNAAHFIVLVCVTCRTKRPVDYVVER